MANFVVNIMANQIDHPTRQHDQDMVGAVKTLVKRLERTGREKRRQRSEPESYNAVVAVFAGRIDARP
jgi:hypothetical protein